MVVIYAEKASLAKEIAGALDAGKRIANPKDKRIGHWEFSFNGEDAVIVHGQGHLVKLENPVAYGAQFQKWDLNTYPCIPDTFKLQIKTDAAGCYRYAKQFFDRADWLINATDADREGELEKKLNDIAEGRADYQQFIDKVKSMTQKWYQTVCGASSDAFTDNSMICPSCGKRLIKGKNNVFCSGYKEGCAFSIPCTICQKKLTENQMQMLINSQRTNIIKGFTSKAGKPFDASLKIDLQGKLEFVFPTRKKGKRK